MKQLAFIKRSHGRHWVGDGFPVQSIFSYNDLAAERSPFLLLDYAGPADFPPTRKKLGVGQHPHRGFETVTIARKHPRAVVCLLTALRFHELTTQAPFAIWLAIPNKARAPHLDYPPLRIVRFPEAALTAGVDEHLIDGVPVRITGVARTVADGFKYRNRRATPLPDGVPFGLTDDFAQDRQKQIQWHAFLTKPERKLASTFDHVGFLFHCARNPGYCGRAMP